MFKSSLHEMTERYVTHYWIKSCSVNEIKYALDYGATGVAITPSVTKCIIKSEEAFYKPMIRDLVKDNQTKSIDEITMIILEGIIRNISDLMVDLFHNSFGKRGRISIQPLYNKHDKESMVETILDFKTITPNLFIEIPSTSVGIEVIEESIVNGVSINATSIYTLKQLKTIVEVIERGYQRRVALDKDISMVHSVCTIDVDKIRHYLNRNTEYNETQIQEIVKDTLKDIYKMIRDSTLNLDLVISLPEDDKEWLEYVGGDLNILLTHNTIKDINTKKFNLEDRINEHRDKCLLLNVDSDVLNIDEYINESYSKYFEDYQSLINLIECYLDEERDTL